MPPVARPFPRFISDSPQEGRPYGRWEERLVEAFVGACGDIASEAGTQVDAESLRWFPDRTWGGRTHVPVIGRGSGEVDGVVPEFFGHVSFLRTEDGEPGQLTPWVDFTDVTAEDNDDWQIDLNDDVVGTWHADGGRGGEVTLIWGTPLVRGAIAATAELEGEVVDQAAVNEGRFTLIAVDAVAGFGDEIFLDVKLWDRRLREIASESLYAEDDAGDEEADDD